MNEEQADLIMKLKKSFRQLKITLKVLEKQMEGKDEQVQKDAIYKSISMMQFLGEWMNEFNKQHGGENENN